MYIAIMRSLLTVILIFFITNSCFALKPEATPAVYHAIKENKISAFARLFSKIPHEAPSSLSNDEFEYPTLVRQLQKKQVISCIQLFHRTQGKPLQSAAVPVYIANAQSNYNFIYHFLYPKHVFW